MLTQELMLLLGLRQNIVGKCDLGFHVSVLAFYIYKMNEWSAHVPRCRRCGVVVLQRRVLVAYVADIRVD